MKGTLFPLFRSFVLLSSKGEEEEENRRHANDNNNFVYFSSRKNHSFGAFFASHKCTATAHVTNYVEGRRLLHPRMDNYDDFCWRDSKNEKPNYDIVFINPLHKIKSNHENVVLLDADF